MLSHGTKADPVKILSLQAKPPMGGRLLGYPRLFNILTLGFSTRLDSQAEPGIAWETSYQVVEQSSAALASAVAALLQELKKTLRAGPHQFVLLPAARPDDRELSTDSHPRPARVVFV